MGQPELLVQRQGHICTLVINRPEKGNFLIPKEKPSLQG
jgi:enoyl-CoA hydratase/carnithine racemase